MPKRKVKTPVNRTQNYLQVLFNLNLLHSPCVSEKCEVGFKHCSGCNESYPCKTAQVLAGRTVAQVNEQIELLRQEQFVIFGDQEPQQEELEQDENEG